LLLEIMQQMLIFLMDYYKKT